MDRSAYGIIATLLTIASAFIASPSVAVSADDEALITQLAEFQKKQGLLAGYTANKGSYHLDVTISPTTPLATGEAGFAGRTTCSLGAQELASKLDHEWTVQVFVAGEATAAYTCEIPAIPAEIPARAAPQRRRPR